MQGGLKVKRSLFSLGLACVAVAAALPASAQINTGSLPTQRFGPFNLAEAYPCTASTYPTGTAEETSLSPLRLFNGTGTNCAVGSNNGTPGAIPGAAPGILCLKRSGLALDVNCFATIPSGQEAPCFVQAFRLYKFVPGSFKCPDVYGLPHFNTDSPPKLLPYTYVQFGTGVRTWWTLNFTQPGTRFLLQVVSVCHVPQPMVNGVPVLGTVATSAIHVDEWRWRVVADDETLLNLIYLMHQGAVSTLEIPCILGEDMYDALIKARNRLHNAIAESTTVTSTLNGVTTSVTNQTRVSDIGNAIFDMEALIVANCLFVEVLNPLVAFPGPAQFGAPNIMPPGNLAQTVTFGTQGSAVAGIIDTVEHPCCCKLLVDLEYISIVQGIIGQTPHLPVVQPGGAFAENATT
jgi:hypothetical protein